MFHLVLLMAVLYAFLAKLRAFEMMILLLIKSLAFVIFIFIVHILLKALISCHRDYSKMSKLKWNIYSFLVDVKQSKWRRSNKGKRERERSMSNAQFSVIFHDVSVKCVIAIIANYSIQLRICYYYFITIVRLIEKWKLVLSLLTQVLSVYCIQIISFSICRTYN